MGGAKSRMTKWSLPVPMPQKSPIDVELALEEPATVAKHPRKSTQHEPDGPCLDAPVHYKRDVLQRTNAPRASHANPTRSQLEAFRRPPSMTFVCWFHGTTRKKKEIRNRQQHKSTDSHDTRFTCPNRFHASQQSLAIAHDFSIFVAPFRRGPRGGAAAKELTRSCPYLPLLALTSGFVFRLFKGKVVSAGGRVPSPVRVVPPSIPMPNALGCCVRIFGNFSAAVKRNRLPEDTSCAFISNRSMLWQRSEGTVEQLLPSRVFPELAPHRFKLILCRNFQGDTHGRHALMEFLVQPLLVYELDCIRRPSAMATLTLKSGRQPTQHPRVVMPLYQWHN